MARRSRSPRRSRRPWRASRSPGRSSPRRPPGARPCRVRRSRRRRPESRSRRSPRRARAARRRAARPARSSSGSTIRSTPSASATLQAPLASRRIRACGPSASRTARTWATSSPAPSLSLKLVKPRPAQRSASAATSAGVPATRVALQRTGVCSGSPEQRPERPARGLAGEVEDRHLERRLGGAGEPAAGGDVDESVDRGAQRLLAREVREVGTPQPARGAQQRPLDRAEVGAAAQRERHRLTESLVLRVGVKSHEQHLAALERSRVAVAYGRSNASA